MRLSDDIVEVRSESAEVGEAAEELTVTYGDGEVEICFNAQYVLDFLAVVDTDTVVLELKDEMSQAVMHPAGQEASYTYVIMPMRV
jgi:DNA polymerase-3 subunit beta